MEWLVVFALLAFGAGLCLMSYAFAKNRTLQVDLRALCVVAAALGMLGGLGLTLDALLLDGL